MQLTNKQRSVRVALNAVNIALAFSILCLLPLKQESVVVEEIGMTYTPSKIPPAEHQKTLDEKAAWCKLSTSCTTLAEAAYYEARGETDAGVVSVLHTILNRVTHKTWPDTIKGVVYQNRQFSYTWDGSLKRGMNNTYQVDRMNVLAYDALHGLIDSPAGESTHYHSTKVNPYWVSDVNYISDVGNHKFYKGDR